MSEEQSNLRNPNLIEQGKNTRFSSTNQPLKRKTKSVSEYLKEFGDKKKIEFEIKTWAGDEEKPKVQKGKIESKGTINNLIALTMIQKAIKGDTKAMNIYLDRTEGKVTQPLSNDPDNPLPGQVTIFELPNNNR